MNGDDDAVLIVWCRFLFPGNGIDSYGAVAGGGRC